MEQFESVGSHFLHTNIRYLRKKLNWSQEELANQIGLNRGNIASYENASAEPRLCNLIKLAQLFKVSIADLTLCDMTQEAVYQNAMSHFGEQAETSQMLIQDYLHRAQELEAVMKGLHTCCMFKTKNFGADLPKDVQIVIMHFEELFNTAQALLREHHSLLNIMDVGLEDPDQTRDPL